ncbi:hypothetical protein [Saccharothrix stipae]
MTAPEEATGAGLLQFLTWAGQRGEMNPATAAAFTSASRNILNIEDNPEEVNLREIDVDQLLERFENRNRTKYSTSSLNTYKGRFRQSVALFLAWLDKDPNWKSSLKRRTKANNAAKKVAPPSAPPTTPKSVADERKSLRAEPPPPSPEETTLVPGLIRYQLPLRPDLLVNLDLPVDLTSADAARIAAFVKSLAFEPVEPPSQDGFHQKKEVQ